MEFIKLHIWESMYSKPERQINLQRRAKCEKQETGRNHVLQEKKFECTNREIQGKHIFKEKMEEEKGVRARNRNNWVSKQRISEKRK